jgi:hypothetical protein
MAMDFAIRNVRLPHSLQSTDIGVEGGLIAAIEPGFACDAPEYNAGGKVVCGGLIETHIHLDEAGIIGRCSICAGTPAEAVSETAKAKSAFTEEDVYARASLVLEKAIVSGTARLRTFVEVDPRAGYRSLDAIKRLKADYADAIEVEICAFAQEGLTNPRQKRCSKPRWRREQIRRRLPVHRSAASRTHPPHFRSWRALRRSRRFPSGFPSRPEAGSFPCVKQNLDFSVDSVGITVAPIHFVLTITNQSGRRFAYASTLIRFAPRFAPGSPPCQRPTHPRVSLVCSNGRSR